MDVNTTDVDLWMNDNAFDDIHETLDDCFSAMDSFDPNDPFIEMEPLGNEYHATSSPMEHNTSSHLHGDRRNSMLIDSAYQGLNQDNNNEFQECFEQFNSDYTLVRSSAVNQPRSGLKNQFGNQQSTSDDFNRNFRRSLSKLEQSMIRSEQSRKLLGEHRSALGMLYNNVLSSTLNNGLNNNAKNGLFAYMNSIGNGTI